MKKNLLFIFLIFHLTSISQEINDVKKITQISIDQFENIFLCEEKKIIKFSKLEKKRLEYEFSKFGQLTKIITTNPLRTTLFFKESQTIIFLDKNLNKLNLELKTQNIQSNIISDIETHSNLVFLLSEKNNEVCIYDLKKMKIKDCNNKLDIKKNKYLKLFLNKENIVLLNSEQALMLDEYLIPQNTYKINNCEKIFFNNNSIYFKIQNKLYKSDTLNVDNAYFIKNLPENKLLYIQNNILFEWKNNFLKEEKLTK